MKKYCAWSVYILSGAVATTAADLATELQFIERGPHHRKVAYVSSVATTEGNTALRTNHYTELATGMHYQHNGQWVETKEIIDIVPGGALASQGPHQVAFAPNINTRGAISFLTPDNKRLRSHVLGLAYTDARTGQSVLIAQIQDSIGELVGQNQIYYRNAFANLKADIRYTYTCAGFEQDIVLLDVPADPAVYGLDPATTRFEVFTEFIEAPEPTITSVILNSTPDGRANMVIPDFVDQTLDFGVMHIGSGQAFPIGDETTRLTRIASTGKTWEVREGRTFLIEALQYPAFVAELDALVAQGATRQAKVNRVPGAGRTFPDAPQQAKGALGQIRTASLKASERGFVIDYSIVSSQTNFTFQSDSTYFLVSGTFNLSGTTIFEGGAVLKFTNGTGPRVSLKGPVDFRTSPYLPVVFTAKDDNSVGEAIAGSTGLISGRYGQWALRLDSLTNSFAISNIVVRHVSEGVSGNTGTSATIWNGQFIDCAIAHRSGGNNAMRNCLVAQSRFAVVCSQPVTNTAEHLTISGGEAIATILGGGALFMTNCLIVATTNIGGFTDGANVYSNTVFSDVFQTVGAADHYLKDDSYRDIGTVSINPELLASLRERTTYPPLWLSNTLVADVTLAPIVSRDTGAPDIGYHYAPLDYFVSGLTVTNSTLLLTNGASVAIDYSATNRGIILKNSKLLSVGSPTNLNRIVRAHVVQERSSSNTVGRALFYDGDSSTTANELRMRFTALSQLASDGDMLSTGTNFNALEWTHSVMQNAVVIANLDGANVVTCGLTNTVWERGSNQFGITAASANSTVHARNNLFKNSQQHFLGANASWTVCDNLVDGGGLYDHGTAIPNRNNAYYSAISTLSGGTSNLTLGSLSYITGPLSPYYQPTNSLLINTGSVSAAVLGLYHFTSTTNQNKELNSVVDVGPHWIAFNTSAFTNTYYLTNITYTTNVTLVTNQSITINDNSTATPYPAQLVVSNMAGVVTNLTVTLKNVTHSFPDDIDMLMVSPSGRAMMIMSDAGGGLANAMSGVTITIDDAASSFLSDSNAITTGSYKGTNYGVATDPIAPYPPGTGIWTNNLKLSSFDGEDPNGVWSLYVVDDASGQNGSIGSWSISIAGTSITNGINTTITTNTTIITNISVVAVGAFESDGDGILDYLEDRDGDGTVDSGETDWRIAADLGLRVFITRPNGKSPLP